MGLFQTAVSFLTWLLRSDRDVTPRTPAYMRLFLIADTIPGSVQHHVVNVHYTRTAVGNLRCDEKSLQPGG